MRQPHHRFAQMRQRREASLPDTVRLTIEGNSSRESAAREAARQNCPTQSMASKMIAEVTAGYQTIYRLALEGLDRSRADKEIRTFTDNGDDDSDKKRSVRTVSQAGNPAWRGQGRAALDSLSKVLRLDLAVQAETTTARMRSRCVSDCRWSRAIDEKPAPLDYHGKRFDCYTQT